MQLRATGSPKQTSGVAKQWQLCANTAEKVGLGAERQKLLATQRVQQFLAEGMHRYWLGLPTKPWLGQTLHQ
jgi:hypothetical protein